MKIGFIGFGEAARSMSDGFRAKGMEVVAFDLLALEQEKGQDIRDHAEELNVRLLDSLKELCEETSLLFNATSAKAAVATAESISPYLLGHHVYVDLNAASPETIRVVAAEIEKSQASMVDAAVMGSIPFYKQRVPILISGEGAEKFKAISNDLGMQVSYIDGEAGKASLIKMARSIFMKGFSALMLETLQFSANYDMEENVLNSIAETFDDHDFSPLVNSLLTRTAIHSGRRVTEMEEVLKTMAQTEVSPHMTKATKETLKELTEKELHSYFDGKAPSSYMEVLRAMN